MRVHVPECPALPDQLILGESYDRPCVRADWHNAGVAWFPVLGTIHNDAEYIKADFTHIHVDYRFMPRRHREEADKEVESGSRIFAVNPVHSQPISRICPEGFDEPVIMEEAGKIAPEKWIQVMKREYTGPYPEYPSRFVPWIDELRDGYRERQLIDGIICPHQGTDLTGIEPDAKGFVTCPLHGLCWDLKTGRMVDPQL